MALSLATSAHEPPRIIIYGNHGLGKSTFGSMAPNSVFIQTEDGLAGIDTPRFPKAESFAQVMEQLGELYNEPHDFKTVVIDSLDHLEPLVWGKVVEENPSTGKTGRPAEGIESYGYGKGYVMALDIWREYLDALDMLRKERGMMIIQTAHSQVKRYENPMSDPYDRFEMKLHARASALLQEKADIVLFANYATSILKSKDKSGNERVRAIGAGDRVLCTEERPAFQAKNRFSLPSEIPFDRDGGYWGVIANSVPFLNQLIKE
jgi:hypothetical protein